MTNLNQTSTTQLDPQCLHKDPQYAYSATGYMLPCCYADSKDFSGFESLMQDHLLIDSIEDIDNDIINSIEWKSFFEMLIKSPIDAPKLCKYYCGNNWKTKNRVFKKNI